MVLYVPRWIAAVSVFLSCPLACSLKEVDKLDRPAVSPKAQGPRGQGRRGRAQALQLYQWDMYDDGWIERWKVIYIYI